MGTATTQADSPPAYLDRSDRTGTRSRERLLAKKLSVPVGSLSAMNRLRCMERTATETIPATRFSSRSIDKNPIRSFSDKAVTGKYPREFVCAA